MIQIDDNDNYKGLSSTVQAKVDVAVNAMRDAFGEAPDKKDNISTIFTEISDAQEEV